MMYGALMSSLESLRQSIRDVFPAVVSARLVAVVLLLPVLFLIFPVVVVERFLEITGVLFVLAEASFLVWLHSLRSRLNVVKPIAQRLQPAKSFDIFQRTFKQVDQCAKWSIEERRFAAASTAAARTDYIPRDRDPPPTYDGENPETTFRQFEKQAQLWLFETEVPETKRGVKLLRQLTGVAATAVDDMEVSEIVQEQGVKNIMQKLREYFTPHLEVSLPRAFETAVYGTPKQSKETFAEYAKRMERAFTNLAKEGVDLPADARGYILYRQASLTEAQDQKLLTWTQGKYSRAEVTSALHRLDKVVRDKAKSSFQVEGTYLTEDAMGDHYNGEEIYYTIPDEDDENFVYIAEGDLDHVLEESEVMEALASYQEVRQQLKDQRLNRGYFPGKGKGKPNYPAKGKDKGGGKRKIHIEQLKLRTRCRRCGQVGHWEKECQTKPKDDNRAFFVRIEEENAAAAESGTHFWFQQETSGRQAKDGTDVVFDDAERSDVGAYMERQPGAITFCGISTQPHHGVVDTAAEGGLVGTGPLKNIEVELARHALKVRWIPKKSQAKGVGGAATVEGTVLIPIGIAGVNGILECTVVQGDALESLIDLKRGTMTLQSHGRIVDLHQLPSGHMSEMNMTQMHQFSEEMKKAAQASREQELRQEKLMQMLVQMKEEQAKADPAASSRAMPPPAAIPTCKCGKPAERLQVKKEESPRKGRWFWKCMQRKCDYFEWEMEEVDLLSETTKTAGSKNPRIQEPSEVQEPTEGSDVQRASSTNAGNPGAHYGSMRQLDEGHGQRLRDQCRPGGGTMSWTTCSTPKGIRWARKAQKGQHHFLTADEEYMIRDPKTGNWAKKKGVIPKDAAEVQVRLSLTRRGHHEDLWDEFKTAGYSRKDRQRLQRAMKELDIHFGKISELYSPPRISPEAAKRGMEAGTCFDLQTGWDLSREEDRRQMWKILREEKPDVIIVCPPCTAFSRMQALNRGRRDEKKALQVLHTGREHLRLAVAVIRWQLKQGRSIVFEHPSTATSWGEAELQELLIRQDLHQIDSHMCAFGMNVTGNGLNLKPTRWLTDMEEVAQRLNRRCDGTHRHEALEGGNKTRLAQVYPPELCRQLAKGIKEHLKKKLPQTHYILEALAEEESEAEEIEDEDNSGEAEEEYQVSEEEKKMILKVHRAVGHPQRPEFIRFLRAARVKGEIIRWAAKEFKCDVCEAKAHPKAARPTTLPRSFQPGRVLGLDLFYIAAPGGGRLTTPVLNMVDWGTNYQMCELLSSKGPEEIWDAFMSTWARTFGQPEVIVCDAGREFMGHFIQRATAEGIVVHQIAAKAPWQAGKTERHGGHFKELLDKARSETVVQDERDLRRLIMEVEQAKNRYSNRSGFAPIQRQIGQWPRIPTAILSDEGVDPMLINGMMVDDIEKLHEMRRVAHKAFCEYNARQSWKKALRARPRIWTDYKPGEYVFVYRVPRQRKRKHSAPIEEHSNKATWVGPGVVIMPDGANLWISMLGEVWKVAREQCRPATDDEKTGIEAVMSECQELIEEFKRAPHRSGYKDYTDDPWPDDEEGQGPDEEPGRRVRMQPDPEELSYVPSMADEELEPLPEAQVRRRSIAEPEQEEAPATPIWNPYPEGVPETPPLPDRAGITASAGPEDANNSRETLDRSISQAWRLDGHPDQSSGPILRLRQRYQAAAPYLTEKEWCFIDDEEATDVEEEQRQVENERKERARTLDRRHHHKDYWEVDLKEGTLTRHHLRRRKAPFDPRVSGDAPIPTERLEPVRKTILCQKKIFVTQEDDWTKKELSPTEYWWTGSTTFTVKNPKELESRKIRAQLRQEGKEDRILPTKIARRYKPAEQPGEPPIKKSRLCIRGDKDPDALELERFAPTLNTVNFNILLQIAANQNMRATVGDLKNAFCQSRPLLRPNGALYFQQPKEGVIGLHRDQIVRIINGCYGLVDAPLHWRKSLTEDLKALGYESSALDPCIFKLYDPKHRTLQGAIAVEVDDLFTVGHERHHQMMKELQRKYTFGKYVVLQDEPDGAAFNGRRIQQTKDGGFLIDMCKFVEERLQPVTLEKGRSSLKKEPATEREKSEARATCGALNWLSKEGRPDAAGPSSLMASKLSRLTVEDIKQLNSVVKDLKEHSKLSLMIQPLRKMKLSVVTDASYANNGFHSQGGHLVIAHESCWRDGVAAPTNILSWRSAKLQRVVNSTMAAETQSLSRGLAELTWTMLLMKELQDGRLNIRDWRQQLKTEELMVISSEATEEYLKESLAVVDAKSLYDHLSRETIGGSDKRTAIEIQIVRDDLRNLQGQVKWVEHMAMIADGLTKVGGSNVALRKVVMSGMFSIKPTDDAMQLRESAKKAGHSTAEIRSQPIKLVLFVFQECEKRYNWCFDEGYTPGVLPMRINFDPIQAWYHPLWYYAAIKGLCIATRSAMQLMGFTRCSAGRLSYFHRPAPAYPGLLVEGGKPVPPSQDSPVVLIHGLGVGITPYLRFIRMLGRTRECFAPPSDG
eukprot:g33295.t1